MTTQLTEVETTVGFYVSVVDGGRHGYLLGPYDTHEAALANVDRGKAGAHEVDDRAHWYGYGTCKVTAPTLPTGRLNDRLGLTA